LREERDILKRAVSFFAKGRSIANMYRFVEAERDKERSVNKACAVLEVSRAAYYEWSKQEPSARVREDQELTEKVRVIFKGSRQTYGSPRVHSELRRRGHRCSRKRVERLMRQQGLQGRPPKAETKDNHPRPRAAAGVDRPDRAPVRSGRAGGE
jgi:hypothetical protein